MRSFSDYANSLANLIWSLAPGSHTAITGKTAKLVAHRGAHWQGVATENTLPAFALCLEQGLWGVELDVRLSRDMQPVILHDPDCGRMFERPEQHRHWLYRKCRRRRRTGREHDAT